MASTGYSCVHGQENLRTLLELCTSLNPLYACAETFNDRSPPNNVKVNELQDSTKLGARNNRHQHISTETTCNEKVDARHHDIQRPEEYATRRKYSITLDQHFSGRWTRTWNKWNNGYLQSRPPSHADMLLFSLHCFCQAWNSKGVEAEELEGMTLNHLPHLFSTV